MSIESIKEYRISNGFLKIIGTNRYDCDLINLQEKFYVEGEIANIQNLSIYSTMGRKYRIMPISISEQKLSLDLTNLKAGIYLLKFQSARLEYTKTLILQ